MCCLLLYESQTSKIIVRGFGIILVKVQIYNRKIHSISLYLYIFLRSLTPVLLFTIKQFPLLEEEILCFVLIFIKCRNINVKSNGYFNQTNTSNVLVYSNDQKYNVGYDLLMKILVKELLSLCSSDKSENLEDSSDVLESVCNLKAMVVGLLFFEVV